MRLIIVFILPIISSCSEKTELKDTDCYQFYIDKIIYRNGNFFSPPTMEVWSALRSDLPVVDTLYLNKNSKNIRWTVTSMSNYTLETDTYFESRMESQIMKSRSITAPFLVFKPKEQKLFQFVYSFYNIDYSLKSMKEEFDLVKKNAVTQSMNINNCINFLPLDYLELYYFDSLEVLTGDSLFRIFTKSE